jgi:predicted ATPase
LKVRRFALSGSAGTGKSTLGRALAERLGLPYIEEGIRSRVSAGLKLYELDEAGRRALVSELWEEQHEQEERATAGFVSDRSSIDYAAFWLHYGLTDAEQETQQFMERMTTAIQRVDQVILCPWGVLPLVSDGVRSTNRWLQLRFQALLEGLHGRYTSMERLVELPPIVELEERIKFVLAQPT